MAWTVSIFLISLCPAAWPGTSASPHELPDNFVERGIAVIVRDDLATVEYRFGASPATMTKQLADWKVSRIPVDEIEITQVFCETAAKFFVEQVQVQAGDRKLPLSVREYRVGGQHHVSGVVVMEFDVAELAGLQTIRISDDSFRRFDGGVRVAFHSMGNVMTRRSKVAPALVRADRTELPPVADVGSQKAVEFEATVLFSKPDSAKTESSQKTGTKNFPISILIERDWFRNDEPPGID